MPKSLSKRAAIKNIFVRFLYEEIYSNAFSGPDADSIYLPAGLGC
jgi:hypothetical protein